MNKHFSEEVRNLRKVKIGTIIFILMEGPSRFFCFWQKNLCWRTAFLLRPCFFPFFLFLSSTRITETIILSVCFLPNFYFIYIYNVWYIYIMHLWYLSPFLLYCSFSFVFHSWQLSHISPSTVRPCFCFFHVCQRRGFPVGSPSPACCPHKFIDAFCDD